MKFRLMLFVSALMFFKETVSQKQFDADFFEYPLSIKPKLNANFGEMRPNHFHMGLDLSTESRQNVPIHAPADGFISRIKIEQSGFGRALYVEHPNGLTTLYAHMNSFIPLAEMYLKAKQYEHKTWNIDINLPADAIPVKKGQLIGFSGNTGASAGPHVHFEIRDSKTENCYNPLRFRFPVPDQMPPSLLRLAFYDRDKSVYEQSPVTVPLIKTIEGYKPQSVIKLPFKKTFIGLLATDRMNGVGNQYGVYKAILKKDGKILTAFEMDNISYEKTRFQNGHIDFLTRFKGGPYYQMLFPPMHFEVGIYDNPSAKNYVDLSSEISTFQLDVYDVAGNSSKAIFELQSSPDEVNKYVESGQRMMPGNVNIYEDDQLRLIFNEDAFCDAFNFRYSMAYQVMGDQISSIYQLMPEYIPVQGYFKIAIKPTRPMFLIDQKRVLVKRTFRGKTEVKKATKEKDMFSSSFRDFGFFQLLEDKEPPVMSTNIPSTGFIAEGKKIVVYATDNNHVISDMKGYIDGEWILFVPSGNVFTYTPDEHLKPGEHKLTLVVMDEAGNTAKKEFTINH